MAAGPRNGVTATSVFWRPDDSDLAVTINTQGRVLFFRVKGTRHASFERCDATGGGLQVFGIKANGLAARLRDRGMIATPHGVHLVIVR